MDPPALSTQDATEQGDDMRTPATRRGKQGIIAGSIALAMVWAVGLVAWAQGRAVGDLSLPIALAQAMAPCGAVLAAMIARLAERRFFEPGILDGEAFPPGSPAATDQRVLSNTVEQLVLALCLWPFAGWVLGPGVLLPLGLSFAGARVVFWLGYHLAPPFRAFGFAATFFPTLIAALWALARLGLGG
jgi:hypothetical protein